MDSRRPLFQIIMPCYNSAAFVERAIESVISQIYSNWRLIAVDDGSTDATFDMLMRYHTKDPRIVVLHQDNGGYCSAVNAGLGALLVQDGFFMMLGSDDFLDKNLINTIAEYQDNSFFDVVGFRCMIIENNRNAHHTKDTDYYETVAQRCTSLTQYADRFPKESAIFFARDTSKCFNIRLLGATRYTGKYGLDADYTFAISLAMKAQSFLSLPVTGYYWTKRPDSLSSTPTFFEKEFDRFTNWTSFFKRIQKGKDLMPEPVEQLLLHYLSLARSLVQSFSPLSKKSWSAIMEGVHILRRMKGLHRTPRLSFANRLFLTTPKLWPFLYSGHLRRNHRSHL